MGCFFSVCRRKKGVHFELDEESKHGFYGNHYLTETSVRSEANKNLLFFQKMIWVLITKTSNPQNKESLLSLSALNQSILEHQVYSTTPWVISNTGFVRKSISDIADNEVLLGLGDLEGEYYEDDQDDEDAAAADADTDEEESSDEDQESENEQVIKQNPKIGFSQYPDNPVHIISNRKEKKDN